MSKYRKYNIQTSIDNSCNPKRLFISYYTPFVNESLSHIPSNLLQHTVCVDYRSFKDYIKGMRTVLNDIKEHKSINV